MIIQSCSLVNPEDIGNEASSYVLIATARKNPIKSAFRLKKIKLLITFEENIKCLDYSFFFLHRR